MAPSTESFAPRRRRPSRTPGAGALRLVWATFALLVAASVTPVGPASAQDGQQPLPTPETTTAPEAGLEGDQTMADAQAPAAVDGTEPDGQAPVAVDGTEPDGQAPVAVDGTEPDGQAPLAGDEPVESNPAAVAGDGTAEDAPAVMAGDETPGGDATDAAGDEPMEDGSVIDDPMAGEAPGEEAPAVDLTVPPKETYGGQEEFKAAEILWSSVEAAQRKLDESVVAKKTAIEDVHRLRKRAKQLAVGRLELDDDSQDVIEELAEVTERLLNRAVVGYQRFGSGSDSAPETSVTSYQEVMGIQRRSKMVGSALDFDELDLDRLEQLRGSLDVDARALVDRLRVVSNSLADAEATVLEIDEAVDQATIEFEAFRAGSEIFIHGVVFPIAGQYSDPFDSFGFPRMPGTPDEHWHEGIDLFADRGTPLVATERGVITKLGRGRLGGLKFWLKGESGSEWYYAHLDSFAAGLADGVVVEAGQLVGYIGNTGNAISTPPHLHMQLHPDGGAPVNPYPLLKVVSDMERAARASGTITGFAYERHLVDPVEPPESATTTETPTDADSIQQVDADAPATADSGAHGGSADRTTAADTAALDTVDEPAVAAGDAETEPAAGDDLSTGAMDQMQPVDGSAPLAAG